MTNKEKQYWFFGLSEVNENPLGFYTKRFDKWLRENSHERSIIINGVKRTSKQQFSEPHQEGEPDLKEFLPSGITPNGTPLTEKAFIECELKEFEPKYIETIGSRLNFDYNYQLGIYIEVLKEQLNHCNINTQQLNKFEEDNRLNYRELMSIVKLIHYFSCDFQVNAIVLDIFKCGNEIMMNKLRNSLELTSKATANKKVFWADEFWMDFAFELRPDEDQTKLDQFYNYKWDKAKRDGYFSETKFIKDEITELEERYFKEIQLNPRSILISWMLFLDTKLKSFKNDKQPTSSNEEQITAKYPVIDKNKYNTDLIYDSFVKKGLLFTCGKEVFDSWFVNGIETKQIAGKIKNKPQLAHFLYRVLNEPERIETAYFRSIFKDSSITKNQSYKLDENDKVIGTFRYKIKLLECEKKIKI